MKQPDGMRTCAHGDHVGSAIHLRQFRKISLPLCRPLLTGCLLRNPVIHLPAQQRQETPTT